MKASAFFLLICVAAAWAQTAPPPGETQQERLKRMAAEAAESGKLPDGKTAAPAAKALADVPDSAAVFICDGVPVTMGEFKGIVGMDSTIKQMAATNPAGTAKWWCGMRSLARIAVQQKLDQASPTREQLETLRVFALGQAEMNMNLNTMQVTQEQIQSYYDAHKQDYEQVRVKAIYIAFGEGAGGKQSRSEAQAKAEADRLRAELRTGADFVKLVKQYSDDVTSRDKDGDFATFNRKQNVPDAIAKAVFALKQGEVSDPVRQPGGYYLLRAEEVTYAPLSELQTEITLAVRSDNNNKWLQEITNASKIEYPNPALQPGK
ncbi:MAG TPA: peptidylprolyl isomerase [Bryobacteraceae bacterium]|nr:peptidylprolyl isomerase [Bryobacteraceae bacterium]